MSNPKNSLVPVIDLPMGGQLLGIPNINIQSATCSADTNLQTQVAAFVASMSCQLKILKLLKPLIEVIEGLPTPPARALQEFSKAAVDLAPCLLVPAPASLLPFLRGLLCLEIRSLNCFLRNLQAVITLAGNTPSPVVVSEVRSVLDSYPPIVGLLDLTGDLFHAAALTIPTAPVLAGGTDPESLAADRSSVIAFTTALQSVVDALGGC